MNRYLTPAILSLALAAPASGQSAAGLAELVRQHPATADREIDVPGLSTRQATALSLALRADAGPALTERAIEAVLEGDAFRIAADGRVLVVEDDAPLRQLRQTLAYLLSDPEADSIVAKMSDAEVVRRYQDLVS